jgi:hypothetical protein
MKKSKRRILGVTAATCLTLLGAASAIATTTTENLLVSAGFTAKAATSPEQRHELQTLPAGEVSIVTQKGETFYVYPDAGSRLIYVGRKSEYQAYRKLTQNARGSARPITNVDFVGGNGIKVREFYGWGPLGE